MSGVFRNIDHPPPHRPVSVYPPAFGAVGGHTRWVERGWGVNNSEDARHCSVLYICKYFVAVIKSMSSPWPFPLLPPISRPLGCVVLCEQLQWSSQQTRSYSPPSTNYTGTPLTSLPWWAGHWLPALRQQVWRSASVAEEGFNLPVYCKTSNK